MTPCSYDLVVLTMYIPHSGAAHILTAEKDAEKIAVEI